MDPKAKELLIAMLKHPHQTTEDLYFYPEGPDQYGVLGGEAEILPSGTSVTIERFNQYSPHIALLKAGNLLAWSDAWE